jgi:hypothetical protein
MNFCKAFDSRNNPCLNSVDTEHGVCDEHCDFYSAEHWFDRYSLNTDRHDADYFFSSNEKLKNVYRTAILEGFITITPGHFQDLIDTGKPIEGLVDYYLLCCLQPGVDPLSNYKLFSQTCKEILVCHRRSMYELIQEDKNILYRFLDPLFNNSVRSFDTMLYHIMSTIVSLEHSWKSQKNSPIYLDNQTVSLIQYIQSHPKFHSEFLWKYSSHNETLIELISTKSTGKGIISNILMKFLESLPEHRRVNRENTKMLFKDQADEIISVGWSPERVRKWCLNLEELKDIDDRWA